ncbi:hypothetical protein [Azohydromonas aeria]|uniref:hypothetical protein n=1 Tax=Azohydromonas aeria TaxID=2590212 RepID=UPI0012FA5F71|nr:hypothetical protein [Azohydromonas aeria]
MEEWLGQARTALNEGNREKARAAYRAAAQSHPAEKLPWLRLSEDYFNAQDYGNAVIAAQEALQRDGQDHVAHSILAMSGLRLAAGSLVALRQDTAYPVGSRDEAITVARSLRDALGATALLAPAASGSPANRPRKPAPPPGAAVMPTVPGPATAAAGAGTAHRAAATTPFAAPAVVPVSGTALPAARTAAPAPSGSPLDKLK